MANDHAIREHMEIIGADGVHVGTVDKIEGDRIKPQIVEVDGTRSGRGKVQDQIGFPQIGQACPHRARAASDQGAVGRGASL